ncbi:helix-turn-helix domain-containing protein [bacterium]|nr:helix-turn-helix domain-containing protein [bacterium]NCQ56139.1 helix-turn-helix domain-containing protein [Candidatus Parcubacteria bacterium]NCS96931.1 helix-turn-helix domain-containing protein [bacterium]
MAQKTSATTRKKKKTVKFASETIYRADENGDLQPLDAEVINEEWEEEADINFDKIWLSSVMEALEQVGNKKIKVANYILSQRDKNTNYLIQTQREIAEKCGVSLQTVSSTLKALEQANLVVGKSGIYQVNPDRIARGKHNKRMAILRIYQQNKLNKSE